MTTDKSKCTPAFFHIPLNSVHTAKPHDGLHRYSELKARKTSKLLETPPSTQTIHRFYHQTWAERQITASSLCSALAGKSVRSCIKTLDWEPPVECTVTVKITKFMLEINNSFCIRCIGRTWDNQDKVPNWCNAICFQADRGFREKPLNLRIKYSVEQNKSSRCHQWKWEWLH